ncbi:MAG: tripartite tricarboxylate transporter permease, partial [Pseudaminobacter sp.]
MELIGNLGIGFSVAFTLSNLAYAFTGALIGTLVGVLPGIGPIATISILLPFTFSLTPDAALIMLAGIYYGAQYGGSTTAILVNLPGESSSVVTAIDGYQMARNGQAGLALATAALASFIAGTFATFLIAFSAPALSQLALKFGPADYFSLLLFGLVAAVILAHGSILKALAMISVGVMLSLIGIDASSGQQRFTFGIPAFGDGIDFAIIAMGLFGIGDMIINLEGKDEDRTFLKRVGRLWPSFSQLRAIGMPALRGTLLGSAFGALPGGGPTLSSFASYALEKKISKDKSRFGRGAIEGVAGPEAANNGAAQTSFIPLLTLGIPGNPIMALMLGAFMMQGLQPGTQLVGERPELFWGLVASMWVGNLMLVILNLPLVGVWVKLLDLPYRVLAPAILLFCCVGAYSINRSPFDVFLLGIFGGVGYILY